MFGDMEIREINVKLGKTGDDVIFATVKHEMRKTNTEIPIVLKCTYNEEIIYFIVNSYNVTYLNKGVTMNYNAECYYNWRNKPKWFKTPWVLYGFYLEAVYGEEASNVLQSYNSCDC